MCNWMLFFQINMSLWILNNHRHRKIGRATISSWMIFFLSRVDKEKKVSFANSNRIWTTDVLNNNQACHHDSKSSFAFETERQSGFGIFMFSHNTLNGRTNVRMELGLSVWILSPFHKRTEALYTEKIILNRKWNPNSTVNEIE